MNKSSKLKEKVAKLERQLKDARYEAEMYKTFYRAKHSDIKLVLPQVLHNIKILFTTLKKISEFAISHCTKDCTSFCNDCGYLELQRMVLNCLKQMRRIDNEFEIEFNDGRKE